MEIFVPEIDFEFVVSIVVQADLTDCIPIILFFFLRGEMENTQQISQMRRLVEKNGVSTEVRVSVALFLLRLER